MKMPIKDIYSATKKLRKYIEINSPLGNKHSKDEIISGIIETNERLDKLTSLFLYYLESEHPELINDEKESENHE